MKMFINDQEINFALENEKVLGDFIPSLEKQIQESGGKILSLLLNGESMPISSEEWKKKSIETIDTIHIEADDPNLAKIHQLHLIEEILNILEDCNTKKIDISKKIQIEDLQHVLDTIDSLCLQTKHNTIKVLLTYVIYANGLIVHNKVENLKEDTDTIIALVRDVVSFQINSIFQPKLFWVNINELVKNNVSLIHTIIRLLNSSNEQLGIKLLLFLNDILTIWIHTMVNVPENITEEKNIQDWKQSHKDYNKNFQLFLNELCDAIAAKDIITINDLLEYEILPLSNIYIDYIESQYPSV